MSRLFDSSASPLIEYGRFRFPAYSTISHRVSAVPDASGRTVKYRKHDIQVSCLLSYKDFTNSIAYGLTNASAIGPPSITADPSLSVGNLSVVADEYDRLITNLQCYLTDRGRTLNINSTGTGDIYSTSLTDVAFGPKGLSCNFTRLGNLYTRLEWSVEYTEPCCEASLGAIGEFNYSIDFYVNEGIITRTISGTAEALVLLTPDGRGITYSADQLRDRIVFPPLDGFTRRSNFTVSQDRRTLSFNLTDSEIPSDNPYYPGIIKSNVTHSVRSSQGEGAYLTWQGSISGSMTVAPGYPREIAATAFFWVVQSRLSSLLQGATSAFNNNVALNLGLISASEATSSGAVAKFIVMTSFEMSEEVFGRSSNFSVGYTFSSNLSEILKSSGLWKPVYDKATSKSGPVNWNTWTASMSQVFSNTGYTQVRHLPSDDVIIDYCNQPAVVKPDNNSGKKSKLKDSSDYPTTKDTQSSETDGGYLRFSNKFTFDRKPKSVTHYPLGPGGSTKKVNYDYFGNEIQYSSEQLDSMSLKSRTNVYAGGSPTTNDNSGFDQMYVLMYGYADRLDSPPAIPVIASIGGLPPILLRETVSPATLKTVYPGGRSVYTAKWEKYYLVKTLDNKVVFGQAIPAKPSESETE